MSNELEDLPNPAGPESPGHEALDWLYRFVAAIELSPAVAVHSQDARGIVRYWNNACAALYGVPVGEALGQPLDSLVTHIEQDEFDAALSAVWKLGQPSPPRDWRVRLRDGSERWVYSSHFPVVRAGLEEQIFCMEMDITRRKELEAALERASQVFENSRDAIVVVDRDFKVQAVNHAYLMLSGFRQEDLIGQILPSLRMGVRDRAVDEHVWREVNRHGHWEGEVESVRSNGERFPGQVSVTAMSDVHNRVTSYMLSIVDITERKRAEQAARHQAEHDPLTGLPNRVLFLDRVHQALAAARRHHSQFALMFLDLDRFKQINDTLGHAAGDDVLKEVAQRLAHCVRGVDTVSRLGGDEFVVLLANIGGVDQAAHVATTVMQALARPIHADGHEAALSVSIGIAICPSDGADEQTLLKHADVAMYHAKQQGRDAFRFFSPEMNAHVAERVQMENMLRNALVHHEFELEYQPEVDISTGRTIGVEALLRWRHPERGLLLPGDFIHVAEESGLIVPIGEWVLGEACRQARALRDEGFPVVVAVNLSNVQFIHNNLVHCVDQALQRSGLDPQSLDLEITESIIMNGDEGTVRTVEALRARGINLTIDDFGTGYSSLSNLRRFPLTKLKIDRSFVGDITRAPADAAMIPAIIAVARSLKLRVIAEGVETVEQLRFLQQHGCDEYQGYYASMAQAGPRLIPPRP